MEKKSEKPENSVSSEGLLFASRKVAELAETLEAQSEIMKSLGITHLGTSNWVSSGNRGIVLLERAAKAISTAITDEKVKQERAKKLLAKATQINDSIKAKKKGQKDEQHPKRVADLPSVPDED